MLKNENVVGKCWESKVNRNPDGPVDRFKACLVAQGCSQSEGIDYDEVYSPVVRFRSIRLLWEDHTDYQVYYHEERHYYKSIQALLKNSLANSM